MPDGNNVRKTTNQFQRQGHTAGCYGNEPNSTAPGDPGKQPRELKP